MVETTVKRRSIDHPSPLTLKTTVIVGQPERGSFFDRERRRTTCGRCCQEKEKRDIVDQDGNGRMPKGRRKQRKRHVVEAAAADENIILTRNKKDPPSQQRHNADERGENIQTYKTRLHKNSNALIRVNDSPLISVSHEKSS